MSSRRHGPLIRTGQGFDAHRFGEDGQVVLGGVVVDDSRGIVATSDGDVLIHAVIDAILGAAGLGDIGTHFPSSDPNWQDVNSIDLLSSVAERVREAGFEIDYVDTTIIAQTVRVAPHRTAMQSSISAALGGDQGSVSVKATTTDGMGFLGRDEGIAALATATLQVQV